MIDPPQIVWLPATLAAYHGAVVLQKRAAGSPLLNPTLLTIASMLCLTGAAGISARAFAESIAILDTLLGAAVVALAIPLQRNLRTLKGPIPALGIALLAGSLTAILMALHIATIAGASATALLSLAPKSATTAVSMIVSERTGGLRSVTACLTIMTGIFAAISVPALLNSLGIGSSMARGLAFGVSGHGLATARAFAEGEDTGCWSALAMCLNAILTAALVPVIVAATVR